MQDVSAVVLLVRRLARRAWPRTCSRGDVVCRRSRGLSPIAAVHTLDRAKNTSRRTGNDQWGKPSEDRRMMTSKHLTAGLLLITLAGTMAACANTMKGAKKD